MVMNNEWITIATHFLGLTNEVSCHCKKSAELAIIANKSEAGAGQNGSQHLNKDNFLSQKRSRTRGHPKWLTITMEVSLHIEHLDESVMQALHQMAREEHVSVEEVVRRQLQEINRMRKVPEAKQEAKAEKERILASIFGSWDREEYEEFERNVAELRQIDPELWK